MVEVVVEQEDLFWFTPVNLMDLQVFPSVPMVEMVGPPLNKLKEELEVEEL
jgi:hypothetical protein